jgi:hypothetical protein
MFISAVGLLLNKIINVKRLEEEKLNLRRTELKTLYENLTLNLATFIIFLVPI